MNGLRIPRALYAPTISLEEYGVVLKPGRIMSTADMTHVQQGFRIPIPGIERESGSEVPVMTPCDRHLKFGKPFERACERTRKVRDWLRATVDSLVGIQERVIKQALDSLPPDDTQWILGSQRQTQWEVVRDLPPFEREERAYNRLKRETDLPELRDVHYHVFGIAGASDVTYNRQLIKVLQESMGETNQDMVELANRTEQTSQMMTGVTTHLAKMEAYMKRHHHWIVKHFNLMELTDDALELSSQLLTMMLEDRLGAVVYLQDMVDKASRHYYKVN